MIIERISLPQNYFWIETDNIRGFVFKSNEINREKVREGVKRLFKSRNLMIPSFVIYETAPAFEN